MFRLLPFLLVFTACFSTRPENGLYPPNDPHIRFTGRVAWDAQQPVQNAVFAWSGSQVEFAFTGTACEVLLQNQDPIGPYKCPYNVLSVYVDTLAPIEFTLDSTMRHFPVAERLKPGLHTVRIVKRTEAGCGTVHFGGVMLPDGELTDLPYPRPKRRVLFIGNSITCGYGVADTVPSLPFRPEHEDWQQTYAAYTARALEAEIEIVCASGRGIYRNYDGTTAGTLPELFPLVSPQTGQSHTETEQEPIVVCVNLGTNDFAKGAPDSAAFVGAYRQFLGTLRARFPHALVVCMDGGMFTGARPVDKTSKVPYLKRLHTLRNAAIAAVGDPRILPFDFPVPNWPLRGAGYHPDAKQQLCYGEELAEWLKPMVNPRSNME